MNASRAQWPTFKQSSSIAGATERDPPQTKAESKGKERRKDGYCMFHSGFRLQDRGGASLAYQESDLFHVQSVGAAQVVSQAPRSGDHYVWLPRELQCLCHHVWSRGRGEAG